MTKPPQIKRDWFKTGVHFIFGAVLGAFLGGVIAARHVGDRPGWVMLLVVLAHSLVVGTLAGAHLDGFWNCLRDGHTRIRWWR